MYNVVNSFITSSTRKVPMRPIMQALEFQISAVSVKPKKERALAAPWALQPEYNGKRTANCRNSLD